MLSYLEKPRIEYLVEGGKTFSEAKKQAQKEVLAIFEVEKENIANSDQLDISKVGEDNAILLAISVILQGKRTVAELSELLAQISMDIREDGILSDKTFSSELINHAKLINLTEVRSNIESKYFLMGQKDSIPDFESIVTYFINNTNFEYTLKIEYPRSGKYGISLLSLQDGETIASLKEHSLKALMPEGFNLKVRITMTSDPEIEYGWFYSKMFIGEISTYEHKSIAFGKSEWTTKENVTDADYSITFEGKGTGLIEIFENGDIRPTRKMRFNWAAPKNLGIMYHPTGKFGENLFTKQDNTALTRGQTYSLALTLPDDLNLDLALFIVQTGGTGTMSFDKSLEENWSASYSEDKTVIYGNCSNPGQNVDLPIVFSGTGECTLELVAQNNNFSSVMFKHFKW